MPISDFGTFAIILHLPILTPEVSFDQYQRTKFNKVGGG